MVELEAEATLLFEGSEEGLVFDDDGQRRAEDEGGGDGHLEADVLGEGGNSL